MGTGSGRDGGDYHFGNRLLRFVVVIILAPGVRGLLPGIGDGAPVGRVVFDNLPSPRGAPLRVQFAMPMSVPVPVPAPVPELVPERRLMLVPAVPPAEAAVAVLIGRAAALHRASGGDLLECFAAVPDPRRRRGIRHPLPVIPGLAVAAILAGCVTLSDITAWISGAPPELLAALDRRPGAAGRRAPHPDTAERVFALLGAQGLADHTGAYLMARTGTAGPVTFPVAGPVPLPALAIDGKAVRGAIGPDGLIPYLLAAATHGDAAVVIAERLIGPKTSEVPEFQPLLRDLDIAGWVLTMDAGHTVRAHATFICEELLAHFVMIVKGNAPKLFDAIDALDWAAVPVTHKSAGTGHGRKETRTIQVLDAPDDLGFPHAAQVFLIERHTTRKIRRRKKNSPQAHHERDPDRDRGAGRHQPVRPRGRAGAPRRLRPRPLGDREQDPLGPRCHVP
jgi:DDE_Tnp_1-associated